MLLQLQQRLQPQLVQVLTTALTTVITPTITEVMVEVIAEEVVIMQERATATVHRMVGIADGVIVELDFRSGIHLVGYFSLEWVTTIVVINNGRIITLTRCRETLL